MKKQRPTGRIPSSLVLDQIKTKINNLMIKKDVLELHIAILCHNKKLEVQTWGNRLAKIQLRYKLNLKILRKAKTMLLLSM